MLPQNFQKSVFVRSVWGRFLARSVVYVVSFVGLAVLAVAQESQPVWAGGAGVDQEVGSRSQSYGKAGDQKAETAIQHSTTQYFWEHPHLEKYEEQLFVEQEHWSFEDEAGTSLIGLQFVRIHPKFKFRDEGWKLDAGMMVLDVERQGGLYQPLEIDQNQQFTLPSIVAEHRRNRMIFHLGWWKEYDILIMDYLQYALSTNRNLVVGGGYELTQEQELSIKLQSVERDYPNGFDMVRDEYELEYLFLPSKSSLGIDVWKRSALKYSKKSFPDFSQNFSKFSWENLFRFQWQGANNFLTYSLDWVDAFEVYNKGSVENAVKEQIIKESDLQQIIDFQAFRWIGNGPVILAWGLKLEQSITQQAYFEYEGHLKVVIAY